MTINTAPTTVGVQMYARGDYIGIVMNPTINVWFGWSVQWLASPDAAHTIDSGQAATIADAIVCINTAVADHRTLHPVAVS